MTQKPTTGFSGPGPHVDPSVSPAAQKYAQDLAARRSASALPKYADEVAGGPTPHIPRFDQPYEGPPATMAQVAEQQRLQEQRGSIIEQQRPQPQQVPAILPTDILPPEAQQDPSFMQGAGSMYAASQPQMAYKYGVIRNGQRLAPQQLGQPGAPPRPSPVGSGGGANLRRPASETASDMAKIEELNRAQQKAEESPLVNAAVNSPAGAAAGIGGGSRGGDIAEKEMTQEELKKKVNELDEFDLNSLHEIMTRDLLNNEEQRKIIEARLEPLDIGSLIVDGFIRQRVPIAPQTGDSQGFVPEYESLSGDVDLALKRLIVEESKTLKVDDRYLLDKYSLMGVAAALCSVNGKPFPPFRDGDGNFSDELFWKRFNRIVKLPIPMLASIGVNYFWFDIRVRRLFVAKNVKNG